MATFDIPESPKFNYMDLNNLQGMDTWDTNPNPMRASDSLNMVKKEGLHQVRHNVNQKWTINYAPYENMITSSIYEFDDETGYSNLYFEADLEENTEYLISFIKQETQNILLNEELFELIDDESTDSETRLVVKTYEELDDSQYVANKGWLCFYTDDTTSNMQQIINLDKAVEGAVIDFSGLTTIQDGSIKSNDYSGNLIEDVITATTQSNSFGENYNLQVFYENAKVFEYNNPNVQNSQEVEIRKTFEDEIVESGNYKFSITGFAYIKKTYAEPSENGKTVVSGNTYMVITNISTGVALFNSITIETGDHIRLRGSAVYSERDYKTVKMVKSGNLRVNDSVTINAPFTWELNNDYDEDYVDRLMFVDIVSLKVNNTEILPDPSDEYCLCTYSLPSNYFFDWQQPTRNLLVDTLQVSDTFTYNILNRNSTVLKNIYIETNNFKNNITKSTITTEINSFINYIENPEGDMNLPIKYLGKIEEYDEYGNTIPYYIKIAEYLGERDLENDSKLIISVWPTPLVKNVENGISEEQGYEKYKIAYKIFNFTNYGESGNRQGSYEHIEFDGKERVFTPIGILSFKCFTTENADGTYQLGFDVENVLDNPYIPTILYGCTPSGLDSTVYEAINILCDKRKVQFLSDGQSTEYVLPEKHLDNYCKVYMLNESGLYEELLTGFTLNNITGIVTFSQAPTVSPVDGKDNIIIEYSKPPVVDSEENVFTLMAKSSDNMVKAAYVISKETNEDDDTKIDVDITVTVSTDTAFDSSNTTYTNVKLDLYVSDDSIYSYSLTSSELSTLKSTGHLVKTANLTIDNTTSVKSRIWNGKISDNYNKDTVKTITTTQPGSKGSNTSISTVTRSCLGFSWIGLKYNASASATVGSRTDGSDSYWTVTESVQIWVSRADYLNCGAASLYGVIDGERIYAGSTGAMNATSTAYPSYMLSVSKKIPYSSGKTSASLGAYLKFGTTVYLSGTGYNEMSAGTDYISLPTINLPRTVTTTTGDNISGSGTGSNNYTEVLVANQTKLNYANTVPGSARLACYYGTKCVTVYGYESDRRIFLTDGTNVDTFSGATLDGTSSINYFPDTNYRVLGEDTEILGYAHKDGYLLTFKRGDDSVYVRYGASLNDTTEFPSAVVTRNLQVLSRPIQINDEILVITRNGIESISYVSQEVRTDLRSYFINNYFQLSSDYNYDKMTWFKEDNLLHIFLGNYEFTCDLIAKSYVREGTNAGSGRYASTLQYQYEWFVGNIPAINNELPPQVTVYQPRDFERATHGIVYENQRAIGFNRNGIFEFSYTDYKVDKFYRVVNDRIETVYIPIKAYWITPFLNMEAINVAKTIKYVYINTRSKAGDMFDIGYIDENGYQETLQKYYSDIKDYTTKLKNSNIPFPKLIQIKSKIRKFMNVKLYVQNKASMENVDTVTEDEVSTYCNTTFDRILIQYQIAGKYRGE